MKQTEISKVRGWWKHLLLLCVTLLGVVGFVSAASPNYPFPQNYKYPYGEIYTGSNVESKIQTLYTTWLGKYYTEGTCKGQQCARIKFVQDGESGTNTVSEGIAYGMLIMVYMDNATNKTQDKFDRLWRYYKANSNGNGFMNWKVNAFTGNVTSGSGNANGATDADVDVATALLLAHKQWGSDGSIDYWNDAKDMISKIWIHEVDQSAKVLKPGDAFNDFDNPCYFITNGLQLFKKSGASTNDWDAIIAGCYSLMKKVANSSTGLIPDWCYSNGTLLTGLKDGKFESIFGYDAVRIPWRLAHAYAWYGHQDAYDMASKITTWSQTKCGGNPASLKDGYTLNGTEGTGGLGGSLKSWGTSTNACFSSGLSIGSMVDSKFSSYMGQCWTVGNTSDPYGAYYTHTTQLLYMLCLTGNMPNFYDMIPVYESAETNSDGTKITLNWTKELKNNGVSTCRNSFLIKTYENAEDESAEEISVKSVVRNSDNPKQLTLTLSSEISEPVITISYDGEMLVANDDGAKAGMFEDMPVTNLITSMEPYPIARYTDLYGTKVYVQWSKEINADNAKAADFSVSVDGTKYTPSTIQINDEDFSVLDLVFDESIVPSTSAEVTVSYAATGKITSSEGTKGAKAFSNATVQNYYMTQDCYDILAGDSNPFGIAAGWSGAGLTWTPNTDLPAGAENAKGYKITQKNADGYICARGKAGASDYAAYKEFFYTSKALVKGRIYVESNSGKESLSIRFLDGDSWGKDFGYSKHREVTLSASEMGTGKWYEFEYTYNSPETSVPYDGISIFTSGSQGGAGGNMTFYIDYLQICPPAPVVEPLYGRVSYDGYQVELHFSTAMRTADIYAVEIYEQGSAKEVTGVAVKTGDAASLIFTLAEPISSTNPDAITASLSGTLKSADGRSAEPFYDFPVCNTYNMTVSTGWYDDFNDASDYVTANVGGDKKAVSIKEVAADSKLSIEFLGGKGWVGPNVQTYSAGYDGYVMDLTGHETVSFSAKLASGSSKTLKLRISVKDYINERASDGFAFEDITLTNSYKTFTYDISSTFFNQYDANSGDVDRTNIYQVLFYFPEAISADGGTLTQPETTIDFDWIKIGNPLVLTLSPSQAMIEPNSINRATAGIEENGTLTCKSSADGYIYVVPGETVPQFSSLEEAVVAGKGVKVACTANSNTSVSLNGIGYGFFYAYAYDPVVGALSTKIPVYIKDVTKPEIVSMVGTNDDGKIAINGELGVVSSETGTLYVIEAENASKITEWGDLVDYDQWSFACEGGASLPIAINDINGSEIGKSYVCFVMDESENISEPSDVFTISEVDLDIISVDFADEEMGSVTGNSIIVTASRPCDVFLVPASIDVDANTVDDAANYVVKAEKNAPVISYTLETDKVEAGAYYVYLLDGTEFAGPSGRLVLEAGNVPVEELMVEGTGKLEVKVGETGSVSIAVSPANASNKTLSAAAEGGNATFEYRAEDGGTYIDVTGVKSTAGTPVTVTVTAAGAEEGQTVTTTFTLTVVQLPTAITVAPADGKTASMSIGEKQTLVATVAPADADVKTVTWSSSDATKVSVNATTGEVEAKAITTEPVTITATSTADNTITGTIDISVAAVQVSAITTTESQTVEVPMNATATRIITVEPTAATNKDLNVESGNTDVATATYADGTLTISGVGVGETTITLTPKDGGDAELVFTVTVTCPTSAPTASDIELVQSFCEGTVNTLAITGSWTPVWYEAATGGAALASTPGTTATTEAGNYTYYVAKTADGCESAGRLEVSMSVKAKPQASLNNTELEFCATTESVELKATGSDNTWSVTKGGSDVTATAISEGKFLPKTAGAGEYEITVTRGTEGCSTTDSKTFTVTAAPTVTLTLPTGLCTGSEPAALSASVDGGTWSGTGVEGATFNPSKGEAIVTYTYTEGACTVVEEGTIKVGTTPSPKISGLDETYCSNAAEVAMTAVPEGGSFKVNDAAATSFNPATATVGDNTVSYTVTVDGCEGTTTATVKVVAAPSIDLSGVQTTACANEVVTLTPATGKWSGTGVDGATFKSATADSYELTYTETTTDGCSASETVSIAVSKPTAPKASSATVALGEAVPTLTAEGTGTITWYDSETATEGTEGATYTPSVSTDAENTFTFYVTNTDGECESEKVAVALVVSGCAVAAPSIAEVDAICDGDAFPELTATGSESTFTWYDAITEGTKLGEGAAFTPSAAGTYYASQSSEECEGPRASVVVVVKEKPAVPTATGASSCSGAALVAMTTLESANWFASKEDAALATASKSYKPEAITETTTFFVNQTVAGCTSDFAEVVYTVKATPEAPATEPAKACLGDAEFAVTAEGSNLQWYDANNSPLGTDAKQTVSGVTTAKDYSYTVTQTVDGCESAPATATLTVNALPKVEITVADEQCSSSDAEVTLTANVGIAVGEGVFKIAGATKTSFVPSSYRVNDVLAITYEFTETATGCVGTDTKEVTIIDCSDDPVASIEVLPAKVSLTEIGQTQQLDITIKYDGVEGQYNSAIACESSDESVAKVDQKGKITAVSTGTATITVASTYTIGKSATCEVSVIIPVKEASFTESSITLASGQSKDITDLLTYTDGAVVTLEWTAGAGLTVVDGVVTAEETTEAKTSTVKVKVSTADGSYKEATISVNIEAQATLVESITFAEGASLTLQENATYKMKTPTVSQATDMSYTWSIEGSGATIDADGTITVTGKSGDSFKVVATANDEGKAKAECVVTISDKIIPVESLAFSDEATYEIYASESIDMSKLLIINPSDATVNSIVWSTANANYGSISEDGVFTGNPETINAAGLQRQANITAAVTDGEGNTVRKQQIVKIIPDPVYVTSITIPEKLSIEVGGSYTFKNSEVTVLPKTADNKEYTWSIKTEGAKATISEEGVITVNENAEVGETFVVVATADDFKAVVSNECEVTILQQTVKIESINVDVEELSLDAGTTKNFYITLLPEGTTQTNVSVTTTDTDILELMDQGEGAWTVRALAGTTGSVITIKSLDNPALVRTINVVAVEKVKSLKIKGAQQVTVGNTVNLTVEVTEPTATDKTVTWSSSNPDVATVSQNGIVLGKNPGVVQITATANDGSNASNFIDISVDKIPAEEVTAKNIELELGQSAAIEAVIKPANASYKNLEYKVADPAIISVDADGYITTLAMGETTVDIIAVADGISKTIVVTVTAVHADKETLYQLINNETYGAYSVYYKVQDNTIMIGWGKGQISPLVYNEFQNAWMDAQTVYYKEFATQEEVDAAARRLNNAIRAMGQTTEVEIEDAVEDVTESVVAVYPTIVSDVVTIEGANMKSVKIVSATGKVVAQETVAGDMIEINAASFAQGNYKVIVETANGVEVKSFIKK